jgi:hypothetical protein
MKKVVQGKDAAIGTCVTCGQQYSSFMSIKIKMLNKQPSGRVSTNVETK